MSLIRIFFNPLDSGSCVEYPVEPGIQIVDFLQNKYPNGFSSMIRVIVGNKEIPIDDIDHVIQEDERITILVMPGNLGAVVPVLINALVATAIGYVINYIFSPKPPSVDLKGEESVVYSLNPTRNAARLGEPVEVGYGKISYPPSYGSAPYSFFYQPSNDQYVDQLMCLGAGQYTVEDVFIGDTPIAAFEPGTVKYWVFLPGEHNQRFGNIGQAVNAQTAGSECDYLFYENVFTSPEVSDIVFNSDTNEAVVSSGFSGTVYAGVQDQETGVQTLDRIEGVDSSIRLSEGDTITIAGSTLNDGSFVIGSKVVDADNPALMTIWPTWKYFKTFADEVLTDPPVTYELNQTNDNISAGPYRAQKLGSEVYRIDCDLVFQRGLHRVDGNTGKTKYHAVSFRFTYQMVDEDTGAAIGAPIIKDVLYQEKRRDVIRSTITSGVIPIGAYEVTIERTAGVDVPDDPEQDKTLLPDDDTRKVEETTWTALKGYVEHDRTKPVYGFTTMMAIRIKATNGIAQAAQSRVRVVATRRGFNEDSSNPAVVLSDIWTNTDYGLGRPLADLDTAKLSQLESLWSRGGAKFNGVFDKRSTGFEAMESVASLMGAKVFQDGGLTSFAQDGIQDVRGAMFTSANMSDLKMFYTFDTDDDFDGVQTSWRDPLTFDERFSVAPVDAINPEKFDLFGCTDGDYAQKMAQYLWNVKLKRRKKVTFTTELDGLIPVFMTRIGVSHPMPDYGQSGVFIKYISGSTWKVDQALDWSINKTNYMIVRDDRGIPSSTYEVQKGATASEVVFVDTPPVIYTPDDGQEPSSYSFGLVYNLIKDFVITKTSPKSDTSVQIEAQVYSPGVFDGAPDHMVGRQKSCSAYLDELTQQGFDAQENWYTTYRGENSFPYPLATQIGSGPTGNEDLFGYIDFYISSPILNNDWQVNEGFQYATPFFDTGWAPGLNELTFCNGQVLSCVYIEGTPSVNGLEYPYKYTNTALTEGYSCSMIMAAATENYNLFGNIFKNAGTRWRVIDDSGPVSPPVTPFITGEFIGAVDNRSIRIIVGEDTTNNGEVTSTREQIDINIGDVRGEWFVLTFTVTNIEPVIITDTPNTTDYLYLENTVSLSVTTASGFVASGDVTGSSAHFGSSAGENVVDFNPEPIDRYSRPVLFQDGDGQHAYVSYIGFSQGIDIDFKAIGEAFLLNYP